MTRPRFGAWVGAAAIGSLSLAAAAAAAVAPAAATAASPVPSTLPSSVVCIPFLTGTGCVQFQDERPNKPGNSKGMKMTLSTDTLTPTNEIVATVKKLKPNEGVRRWNYNIFGQNRMNEYSGNYMTADSKGNFVWTVAPSTAVYEPSWGDPALCVRGIQSMKLACATFKVSDASSGTTAPAATAPATPAPSTPKATTPAPATPAPATPAPGSSGGSGGSGGALPSNCRDYGFTIICTG